MSTKELILEEALRQFSQKGFDGTSMSDIAGPLGITKAALYKHFESKQRIFDEIIAQSEVQYQNRLKFTPHQQILLQQLKTQEKHIFLHRDTARPRRLLQTTISVR